jgi:hypothetical protein
MNNKGLATFCTVFFIFLISQVLVSSGCLRIQSTPPASTNTSTPQTPATGLTPGGGSLSASQPGQSTTTYGAYAPWTGKWETTFFRFGGQSYKTTWDLKQIEINVTGTYDWDNGRINCKQTKTSGLMVGTWSEAPTYKAPDDAGDLELQQSIDGNSFTGKWRYGSSGDWVGEWNGKRIR